jgi:N-acetylmuramoyl-L-alanine amidase
MARTGTPPREKARVYRTGRPDRLSPLLFAVAALILCAGIGAVLWHEWQGTRPTAAEQAEADEIERADGGEEEIAAVTEEAADGKIVVAIDPGHGGVNPSVGGEDAGSLGSGLREADVTLKTATLVYDKLARDGRFAPMLTANGTEYLKPSRRAARAKAAGAQLLLSIHLNYDADSGVSGFECCPATPQLSTNADSLRFARLVAEKFGAMGMELRGIDGVRQRQPLHTRVQRHDSPLRPDVYRGAEMRLSGGAGGGGFHHKRQRRCPGRHRRSLRGGGTGVL